MRRENALLWTNELVNNTGHSSVGRAFDCSGYYVLRISNCPVFDSQNGDRKKGPRSQGPQSFGKKGEKRRGRQGKGRRDGRDHSFTTCAYNDSTHNIDAMLFFFYPSTTRHHSRSPSSPSSPSSSSFSFKARALSRGHVRSVT